MNTQSSPLSPKRYPGAKLQASQPRSSQGQGGRPEQERGGTPKLPERTGLGGSSTSGESARRSHGAQHRGPGAERERERDGLSRGAQVHQEMRLLQTEQLGRCRSRGRQEG